MYDPEIASLLEAATHAPSAENRQPWEFVIVRDAEARRAIGDLTRRAWDSHGRAFSETRLEPKLLAEIERLDSIFAQATFPLRITFSSATAV